MARVLICTAESPQVLLHGLQPDQEEYIHVCEISASCSLSSDNDVDDNNGSSFGIQFT